MKKPKTPKQIAAAIKKLKKQIKGLEKAKKSATKKKPAKKKKAVKKRTVKKKARKKPAKKKKKRR